MDPNQQQLLLTGGAKESTYVDEVFNTQAYMGNATERTINTGINLAEEGGLLWFKNRENSNQANYLFDTTSPPDTAAPWYGYMLSSNTSNQRQASANGLKSFNNNGFTIQTDTSVNANGVYQAAWSFRKAKGFFDIVTWTGNSDTNQTIPHLLGCVPGCIMIKSTSHSDQWTVYHRGAGQDKKLILNESDSASSSGSPDWSNISSTSFEALGATSSNEDGYTYVAYLWAGGESTAATARSVNFNGSNDTLTWSANPTPSYDDFHMTGDFTIECWIYPTDWSNSYSGLWGLGQYNDPGGIFFGVVGSSGELAMQKANNTGGGYSTPFSVTAPNAGQWTHVALVRSGTKITVYYDGIPKGSWTDSTDWGTSTNKCFNVGSVRNGSGSNVDFFKGKISNVRVVNGTAVYTDEFRVPNEPLANITNTKLLCCNDASVTGSTVTPGTITAVSSPTASTDSSFDDPKSFLFGEKADQQIIKCGRYVGRSGANTVNLGWEPQWVLVKNITTNQPWAIVDSTRGWVHQSNGCPALYPNSESAENDYGPWGPTTTGWASDFNAAEFDQNEREYVYIAIRRPEGYVGKPPEAGTDVFSMTYGKNDNTVPTFVSNHLTDFTLFKNPSGGGSWYTQERIHGTGYMVPSDDTNENPSGNNTWDFSNGFYKATGNWSTDVNWMWKRGAGFDIVDYTGNDTPRWLLHGLNGVPEMIWVKRRTSNGNWWVYHVGANGGVNPHSKELVLNTDAAEQQTNFWEPPTSTHFYIGGSSHINDTGTKHLVMLFKSVEGVSKLGYYDGASGTDVTINTGFQPRWVLIKAANNTRGWTMMDTLRGWGAGNDNKIYLNSNNAQQNSWNYGQPTATGFTVAHSQYDINYTGWKYIYYAHA